MKIPYYKDDLSNMILDPSKEVFFDTETIGLYGKIRLAQFYQKGNDHVVIVDKPNPFELTKLLDEHHVVMHNGHYDITCIQVNTETRWEPKNWDDTLYLSRLFYYMKEGFSLDEVMDYVLGFDPYLEQLLNKAILQKSDWGALVLSSEQLLYAATDVFYLSDVWDVVKQMKKDTNYLLDKYILSYSLDFQNNGLPVDSDKVHSQYEKNLEEIEKIALPINANSWKQVRPYIGSADSDKLGLTKLALKGNDKARDVKTTRTLLKQNSFLSKFDTSEGRIFGKFQPSARSGRFTCKDQNLEQLPRKLKGVFGVDPGTGRCLIYSDYPQIELRSVTCITGELRMANLFRQFEDLHSYTAEMLFGKGYTKDQRQVAKTANFGLLYGASWKVFQAILLVEAEMWLPELQLKSIINRWKQLWSTIAAWQESGISAWRNSTPWATPFGRRYVAKMMTDQLNICNQGFAAEIAKLAMHYMMPNIKDIGGRPVELCNFIHDSYIFECDIDQKEETSIIVADAMQKAWFEALRVGKGLKIRDLPMPVNVYAGYNWGDIEKGDFIYEYKLVGMEHYETV